MKYVFGFIVGGLLASSVWAAPNVKVEGLFKGAAYVRIDGETLLLRQGQIHESGIQLLQADSKQAVIKFQGKVHHLGLHSAIGGTYQEPEVSQVSVHKNNRNQYIVAGSINGMPVDFLVDTGATVVAMSSREARNLGLQYKVLGTPSKVVTASGVANSWELLLDQVKVGDIRIQGVEASVVEGDHPTEVLLGMSFLQNVRLTESNRVLTMEKSR